MEEWKGGKMEEWKGEMMEEWKSGRVEEWKRGKMEYFLSDSKSLRKLDWQVSGYSFQVSLLRFASAGRQVLGLITDDCFLRQGLEW